MAKVYCSVDDVREMTPINYKDLGFTNEDNYNKYILRLTELASRFIDGETQRPTEFFQTGGVTIIEYFDGVGSTPPSGMYLFPEQEEAWKSSARRIYLSQRPVLSITSVEENKAEIGETDDWQQITKYRWYKRGEIIFASDAIPAKGYKNVRVTYTAGYTETPRDIQMACARLVVNMIHKLMSDKSTSFISFQRPTALNFTLPEILTEDIKAVLKRYKLSGYGEM